jgi:restriction system protein
MASSADLPSSKKLVWPVMQALKRSSAPTQKSLIDAQLIEILGLSQDLIAIRHDNSRAEYQYRSAWALSYGKKAGYFENPARNQWALTEKGRQIDSATELVL